MAEAAFKTMVLSAGKNQKSLTVGWEVLGLNKETATRIFKEEAKDGFLSEREKMYAGQSRKYDKKGNQIDKDDEEAIKAAAEADADDEAPSSNVFECSDCGYTLFVAKGREFKFYGDDFSCPECGAGKDKFNAKALGE
jgi:rubredoxin